MNHPPAPQGSRMTWSEMKQGLYFLHMYLQINGHKQFPQLDLVQKKKKIHITINTDRKYLSNYRHVTPLTPEDTLPHTYIDIKTKNSQTKPNTDTISNFLLPISPPPAVAMGNCCQQVPEV